MLKKLRSSLGIHALLWNIGFAYPEAREVWIERKSAVVAGELADQSDLIYANILSTVYSHP
jgi:hypothetical protein